MNTHGLICDFGRHNGTLYTRMPVQYLKWMVQSFHSKAEIAQAELSRRGTVTPDLDISGHAIDSASLRLRRTWHDIVELEPGVWLAPWGGDPGRTVSRSNARNFKREHLACDALERARRFRKFENAKVIRQHSKQQIKVAMPSAPAT